MTLTQGSGVAAVALVVAIATAAVLGSLLLAYPIGFETLWSARAPGKAAKWGYGSARWSAAIA